MTCLLIDDEPLALKVLEKYLAELPDWEIVGTFTQPTAALAFLRKQPVDVLFLDINMPDLSELNLVRALPTPPLVILTTAYPEYAVESYELDVVDYLLKPFALERFLQATARAEKRCQEAGDTGEPVVLLRADRRVHRVPIAQISHVQAYGDYLRVYTTEGQLLPKMTLTELEELLPAPTFKRVHRTWLVNRSYVAYLEGNHLMVNDELIPISKSHRAAVMEWVGR